jgi:hypothetical protein
MKITKTQLKQIIKEELNESEWFDVYGDEPLPPHSIRRGTEIETGDPAQSLGMDQEGSADIGGENKDILDLTTAVDNLKQKHDYSADEILEIVRGLVQRERELELHRKREFEKDHEPPLADDSDEYAPELEM